jgi:4'-phosphopantetheinyl transferase
MITWPASAIRRTIARDEIHLWAWPLHSVPVDVTAHLAILGSEELQRMQRFHFAEDRDRFALVHANLRTILGAYLNRTPEEICFRTNRFGKPELVDRDSPSSLHFSLSHSQSIAVVALGQGLPLGVDV